MPPSSRSSATAALAFVAIWCLVSGGLALVIAPRAIGHDQAALLRYGVNIAAGAVPFRDFLDINSPVIHYVNAIPASVAALARANPIPWFTAMVVLLSAWSALMADRALRAMQPAAPWLSRLTVMIVPLGPGTVHLTLADPGQREHLFVLLSFPFLMTRVAAAAGAHVGSRPGRFALGMAAAVGVTMKPYFIVPVAGFELGLLLAARRPRLLFAPEVWGAVSFAAVLLTGFALLPSDAREVLTGLILPSLQHGYTTYGAANTVLIKRAALRLCVGAIATALSWRLGPNDLRPAIVPVAGFLVGALAAAMLQAKGFGYHYIPADTVLIFLATATAAGLASRDRFVRLRPALAAAIVTVMLAWRPLVAWHINQPHVYPFAQALQQYTRPGDAIMVLSTTAMYAQPATLRLDRVDVARQSAFVLMLARQADAARGTPGELAGRVVRELADEITRRQPAVVFFDRTAGCPACPPGEGIAAVLENDPEIRRALRDYDHVAVAMNFDVFARKGK